MANERFFFSQKMDEHIVQLQGDEHFHLSRVLRKNPGDIIWTLNGLGLACEAQIRNIDKEHTIADVIKLYPELGEAKNRIAVGVGIIKHAHWEILLEKAAELGVYEIFPLITRYTVKTDFKRERSEKILLSAVKQCGRSRIPLLHPPRDYRNLITALPYEHVYICDNQEDYPLLQAAERPEDALVLIGPEGGFHQDELLLAINAGAKPVMLANRRLRTETACILALSRLVV
jgi:16S rRNA (uracil1498-N3)-methyltransferase